MGSKPTTKRDLGKIREQIGKQAIHDHLPDEDGESFGEVSGCWWAVCVTCGQRIFRADDSRAVWRTALDRQQ